MGKKRIVLDVSEVAAGFSAEIFLPHHLSSQPLLGRSMNSLSSGITESAMVDWGNSRW
jgi:hypothetical protein